MTRPPPSRPAASGDEPAAASLTGFAAVAKRVSLWAVNLLATGLVLIAGFVFGRQVIVWWRSDPARASSRDLVAEVVGPDVLGSAGQPKLLEFGDFPHALQRSQLTGDVKAVLAELRRTCRSVAQQEVVVERVKGPAERRMLNAAEQLEPVEEEKGVWRMYQLAAPLPMVVAVRNSAGVGKTQGQGEVAALDSRVVSWGLAVPLVSDESGGRNAWTLFTYAVGGAAMDVESDLSPFPAPPESYRTMSLQGEAGGGLVALKGHGRPLEWMLFFDREFAAKRWKANGPWQNNGQVWRRRFAGSRLETVDVQIVAGSDGSLSGMLAFAPPRGRPAER